MSRHKVQKSSFGNNAAPKKSSFLKQATSWTNPYEQSNDQGSEQPTNTVKPPTTEEWLKDNIMLKTIETRQAQLQQQAIQAKLTVGEPGDKYEQEADMMASRVMSMPDNAVQRASEEVQTKPANTFTPLVQRAARPDMGGTLGEIQTKSANGFTPIVQRAARPDMGGTSAEVQTKSANAFTPIVQRAARPEMGGTSQAHGNIESRLNSTKGGGRPLSNDVRGFMEPRFGANFSQVRVHTDSEAVQMSRELGAQAFTHGSDVYYGEGKAPGNNELTAHELTHVVQQTGTIQRQNTPLQLARSNSKPKNSPNINNKIAFVRKEGLNLCKKPDQNSVSLAKLKFGQRVHTLEDSAPQPGWQKVAVLGKTGYVDALKIHLPPDKLIQQDPALSLIKVQSGETFWGLVKKMYGIKGNESTPDQNINHFINAIRAFNKPEAFTVKTGRLGNIANSVIPGRDASNTELKPVDLWIPSFGVAAKMDVGSGTVTGEVSRNLKKIDQKIEDFKLACYLSGQFIPGAITRHAANASKGLLEGLKKFAKDAAIILATSTTVGALIGSMFGGVGAIPGAEIGFEIGILILNLYGLKMLVEAIFGIAGNLLSQLGQFIKLVWTANGDRKQLEEAAKSLAEAFGSLVDGALLLLVAYLAKKGADAISKTKFAQTVGEKPLIQWLKQRQQLQTTRAVKGEVAAGAVNFMDNKDKFFQNVSKRTDIDSKGTIDVIGHGTPNKIEVTTANGRVLVDHRVASKLIRNTPGYNGQPIRLLSCQTGSCDAGFAQNLANKLGVPVRAPTDFIWAYGDGTLVVAPRRSLNPKSPLFNVPDLSKQGTFRTFTPGKSP